MEKFITAAGCALRISDRGTGPHTLVLLHGYLESLDVWDDFTQLLTPQLRVIALDLPGHGISEVKGEVHTMEFLADVVCGALDVLGVQRCVMAGHSMGGYVALEFLRKYPERLAGMVLFHSTPNPDSEQKKADRQREIEIVQAGHKNLLSHTPAKGFAADNRTRFAAVIEELAEQISLTDDAGIIALLRGMQQRRDNNPTFHDSPIPELIILGRKDEYITAETAATLLERQPQAQIAWLEHSGHMGFVEEPEQAAQVLLDFCEKVKREA